MEFIAYDDPLTKIQKFVQYPALLTRSVSVIDDCCEM